MSWAKIKNKKRGGGKKKKNLWQNGIKYFSAFQSQGKNVNWAMETTRNVLNPNYRRRSNNTQKKRKAGVLVVFHFFPTRTVCLPHAEQWNRVCSGIQKKQEVKYKGRKKWAFYSCCNLKREKKRKSSSGAGGSSPSLLLTQTLHRRNVRSYFLMSRCEYFYLNKVLHVITCVKSL